jgi:proteasome accessory factor B
LAERADRLERLLNLVTLLLESRRHLTLEQIANELPGYPDGEHNRRTAFERDKRTLREAGITIDGRPLGDGTFGYRIRPEDYYLDLDLEADERVALQLAVSSVRLGTRWGEDALRKLGDDVSTPAAPPLATLPNLDILPLLHDARRRRATVGFAYRGEARRVDPYALLLRKGRWYLTGLDHDRGELRNFRVDRIDAGAVEVGDDGAFDVPEGFVAGDALTDDPKLIGEGDETEALVLVDAETGARVLRELGADALVERRAGGRILVRVRVVGRDGFRTWLLGFGAHAQVVAPDDLRTGIVDWLRAVAEPRP